MPVTSPSRHSFVNLPICPLFLLVAVRVANGQCTGLGSITFTVEAPPAPTLTAPTGICNGQSATIAVNQSFNNYLWSTGGTGSSINVNQAGTYTVTVTNAAGCEGTATATIAQLPDLTFTVSSLPYACNGTLTLEASGGLPTYAWSNGGAGSSINVSTAGTYTVTATDNFGCTDTETVSVSSQPAPVPQVNQPAPICAGGTATIAVSNPIFQNYLWSNGGNGSSINVSTAGTYRVTVTDAGGCTGAVATSLTVNPSPVVAASQQPYQCNGLAELSATPGFQNYAWSNGGSTVGITVSTAGSYVVTVTDANGCTGISSVSANIPPALQASITGNANIYEGASTVLSATAGFAAYLWSKGQGSSSISVNSTGTYFVMVTDDFACTATASFNVTAQPAPEPQITGPSQICAGGTAVFTATGGSFASYLWSNGSQSPSISVFNPGTYSLTVTNAGGCTGTSSVSLTVVTL